METNSTRPTRTMSPSELEADACECCRDNENTPYYGYKGYVFSKLMPKMSLDDLQKWEARKNDVFLVGYPGSCTDLLRKIVWQSTNTDDDEDLNRHIDITTECTHLNIRELSPKHNSTSSNNDSSPRLITTHLPADLLPPSIFTHQCKVIYLARHPKEVAVEYFQITNQDTLLPRYRTWRRFYKDFRIGHVYGGSWFDHMLYWWARRHEQNVLFIKYGELFTDTNSLLSKFNSFLGCESKRSARGDTSACSPFSRCDTTPVLTTKNEPNKHMSVLFSEGYTICNIDWRGVFKVSHNEDFDSLYKSKMADCDLELEFGW